MMRARSEVITFNRDDIEKIVRHLAQSQIAGSLFIGKFGAQAVRWMPDGGVEVETSYVQGEFSDLSVAAKEPTAITTAKRKR
jgi:hypothetical protein